jgi:hypothetical protein
MGIAILSALLSGLVATWVSIWFRDRYQARQAKLDIFRRLLGHRHVLLPGPHDPATAVAFSEAVNQIFVVFHDTPTVITALKLFWEAISEQASSVDMRNLRLLELFKAMAQHLKISAEPLGDNFFMRAFTIDALAPQNQPMDFQFHGVKNEDGNVVVVGSVPTGMRDRRAVFMLPADTARVLGCTFIELGVIATERANELRQSPGRMIDIAALGVGFTSRIDARRRLNERTAA